MPKEDGTGKAMNLMMPQIPLPEKMNVKDRANLIENWNFFEAAWRNYEIASGQENASMRIRVATLLTAMGQDCYKIVQNLDISQEQRGTVDGIMKSLENYFKPQRNIIYERYIFHSAIQEEDETIDQYVCKLRHLASSCEFGSFNDDMIRDRLVIGIHQNLLRKKLLQESKLTLVTAIDISRASELMESQMKMFNKNEEILVANKVSAKIREKKYKNEEKSNKQYIIKECRFCGNRHMNHKEDCPAYGQICKSCKKMNHFARKCYINKRKSKVNQLADDNSSEGSCLEVTSDERAYQVRTTLVVKALNVKKRKSLTAHLEMFKRISDVPTSVSCQLDTGATCNVMGYEDYKLITGEVQPKLQKSNVHLKCYGGEIIKTFGVGKVYCKVNDFDHQLEFQVIKTKQRPLISAETCLQLNLVKIDEERVHVVQNKKINVNQNALFYERLTEEFKDIFEGLGKIGGKYHIEVDPSVKPKQELPRRIPVALRNDLKNKIKELEDDKLIVKVKEPTDWISNIVLVRRNNKLRFCLDPQNLNKAIKRSHYQVPTIDEILPSLHNAKIFSVLDAKNGFWQIELDESSSKLTTFWTPQGRYRFLRLAFGLKSAPEEYQRRQHEILQGLKGVEVIADDILVYGSGDTYEEAVRDHNRNLRNVFQRARETNLKLNKQKMRLALKEVKYMGHVISESGLKADPEKTEAILKMPRPKNAREVQTYIGFVNYLSRYLPQISGTLEPIRKMLRKDVVFKWMKEQEEAFQQIKQLVSCAPVLKFDDLNENLKIQCDASEKGLGAVLIQSGQPVAYASRALTSTECQYAQIEKECLAITFACGKFDQYLCGKEKVIVESDHKPLEIIFKKSLLMAPKRLQRMLLRLQRYNLEIVYKKGKEMYLADHLSRAFVKYVPQQEQSRLDIFKIREEKEFIKELEEIDHRNYTINVSDYRIEKIREETSRDLALSKLIEVISRGWPENKHQLPIEIHEYWLYRDELTTQNGVIYKGNRIVVPRESRKELLNRIHYSHLGVQGCLRRARDSLFWPNMTKQIIDKVKQCDTCNELGAAQAKQSMQTHRIPKLPWNRVTADLFEINMTGKKQMYIIFADWFSDYFEIEAIPNIQANTVVEVAKRIFSIHGIPEMLDTDNGTQFLSKEFIKFSKEWEFRMNTSSPLYSQSNGKVEATVKIAKHLIKKAIRSNRDVWKVLLEWRNTPTAGMDSSPVQRLMSRRTRSNLPQNMLQMIPEIQKDVPNKIIKKRQVAKFYYDKGIKKAPVLDIGQEVLVQTIPENKEIWKKGIISNEYSDRSYDINVDDRSYRRNTRYIRPIHTSNENVVDEQLNVDEQPTVTHSSIEENDNLAPADITDGIQKSRSGRVLRKPTRYGDFASQ